MRLAVVVLLLGLGVAGARAQPAPAAEPTPAAKTAPAAKPTPAAKRAAAKHRRQAKVHLKKQQRDLAIRELELSVEQVPDPEVLFELGQLYEQVPDEAKALAAYQRITEGKRAAEAQTRIGAIAAARIQREADAKAKADAEAAAKAAEEARRRAEAAAEAARQADEERRRAEQADRERRRREAEALEAATRKLAEQRLREGATGGERASWELDRTRRQRRRATGIRFLKIGIACGAVAGAAAAFGAIQTSRVENGGFETASDISFALSTGRISNYVAYGFGIPAVLGIAVGVPLVVLGRDRGDFRVSAIASDSMQGFALSGTWR